MTYVTLHCAYCPATERSYLSMARLMARAKRHGWMIIPGKVYPFFRTDTKAVCPECQRKEFKDLEKATV